MSPHILVSVEQVTPQLLANLTTQQVGLELSYFANPVHLEAANLNEQIAYHKTLLQDFNLPKTMHGAFYDLNPVARDARIIEVCYFRVNQSLEIAAQLGMKKVVFHTNYIHSNYSDYKKVWIDKQVAFWTKLKPTLESLGISIYLENTSEENATYINTIVELLDSPHIAVCYDTGHSHCFTNSKISPVEWVKVYGNKLGYVHLHSNHGAFDEHIAFTKGTVNFEGFFEAFMAIDPLPYLIIEVKKSEDYHISLAALREMFASKF